MAGAVIIAKKTATRSGPRIGVAALAPASTMTTAAPMIAIRAGGERFSPMIFTRTIWVFPKERVFRASF